MNDTFNHCEIEADAAFHEHGIRAALLDYVERFGAERLRAVLTRALSPYHFEVLYHDTNCISFSEYRTYSAPLPLRENHARG